MANNLDVIICTYNRPNLVSNLINQIKKCNPQPNSVIVVDSSDSENNILKNDSFIKYIRSDRKSQPYQRYLGAEHSIADVLVFFDDDVSILENNLFEIIKVGFNNKEIVGVSLGIHYDNGIVIKQNINLPQNKENNTGKISWLGRTNGLPNKDMLVDYFPGPIMSFRRDIIFKLFDEHMFRIFEKRIAMGEDKVISMRASKYGKLLFFGSKDYLYHPPEPSTYFENEIKFIAKTTYSRLWISKVYAEVRNKNKMLPYIYFTIYFVKQIVFSMFNIKKLKGNFIALELMFKN